MIDSGATSPAAGVSAAGMPTAGISLGGMLLGGWPPAGRSPAGVDTRIAGAGESRPDEGRQLHDQRPPPGSRGSPKACKHHETDAMPHVEIRGPAPLSGFHARFAPRSLREGETVTKAVGAFLAHDGRTLLLDLLVVEGYLRQSFFLVMTEREGGTMVRLLPRTSPEKTAGVKRAVAWAAAWLQAADPSCEVGTTNLAAFLASPFPPDSVIP
jgi:hypothetical protein